MIRSWADTSARRRETTAVENHGSESRQDGPDTSAGGSVDVAVVELVESKLEDDIEQDNEEGQSWQNLWNSRHQEESDSW